MATKFYSFDKIHEAADCLELMRFFNQSPVSGDDKFNIPWRAGSDSGALSVCKTGWKDFVTGESGDALELVRRIKFNGMPDTEDYLQDAQEWLGEHLNLTPEKTTKEVTPGLKEQGYELVCSYPYRAQNGELRFSVERWYNPTTGKKTFVQRNAAGRAGKGCIADVDLVLYRWPEWADKDGVAIVEGEKDADSLFKIGIEATTNNSGCGHWQKSFTDALAGKKVIIFSDNDDPGYKREAFLLWELKSVVKSIKVVNFREKTKGYDVTDFLAENTPQALIERIKKAPFVDLAMIREPDEDYNLVQEAKQANKFDFANYIESRDENGEKIIKPRQINDLVQDIFTRFVGFPRKVGETLFDHDRDNHKIVIIRNDAELFAWIQRKSKRLVAWKTGDGMATKKEMFAAVHQAAHYYEEIIKSPSYPPRNDAYYEFPPLPPPDAEHANFWRLIDFFTPATEEDRVLIAALFCAPFYYERGVARPCWIIDSEDGAGSGKTTMAEMVAKLSGMAEIRTSPRELSSKFDEVMKRIVSVSGRQRRVLLLDNVTENFHCSAFADMVTAGSLSGRPPYGYGEETRPNNLTYIITANSARMDNDITQRSFFVVLSRPKQYDANWKNKVIGYIENNMWSVIADIIDIISRPKSFVSPPKTRFPEFERNVLQGVCRGGDEEYIKVLEKLGIDQDNANTDSEIAQRIEDEFKRQLLALKLPAAGKYFIRSEVAGIWLRKALYDQPETFRNITAVLRDLARQGFTTMIDGKTNRISKDNRRGFLWNKNSQESMMVIGMLTNRDIGPII